MKTAFEGEWVVITSRGKPLANIVAASPKPMEPRKGYGSMPWLELHEETPEEQEAFEDLFEAIQARRTYREK